MIQKTLKENVVLSIKRNARKELLIILLESDVAELSGEKDYISQIGLNHNNCLEIHGNKPTEVVEYTFDYNPDIVDMIKSYDIENVLLGLVKDANNLNEIRIVFEGLLKVYPRMVGNANG